MPVIKLTLSVLAGLALLTACGGGGSGTTTASTIASTTTGGACTPAGETSAATVNAVLAKTYSLKFFKDGGSGCGTVCSFTEGGTVNVVLAADGKLTVGTLELTSPFNRKFGGVANTAESIWIDCAGKIEYALTNNTTGTFNEINVGDTTKTTPGFVGVPGFIGQIR